MQTEPTRSRRTYEQTARVTVDADADLGDPFARVAVFNALVARLKEADLQLQTSLGAATATTEPVTAVA
jgi:hypothetical protein